MTIIRLKAVRRLEQRISKVKELMDMYNINPYSNYQYQYHPMGASSSSTIPMSINPKIQKTRDLFDMFHLTR